jgi:hypothetical protein
MAVTLYGNFIDYNGRLTFKYISYNCHGTLADCGDFQCESWNCAFINDEGEGLRLDGTGYIYSNCNCL